MHENSLYVCVGGNHFELEGQTKVILIEKHETQIYQLEIIQKPEIVQ